MGSHFRQTPDGICRLTTALKYDKLSSLMQIKILVFICELFFMHWVGSQVVGLQCGVRSCEGYIKRV